MLQRCQGGQRLHGVDCCLPCQCSQPQPHPLVAAIPPGVCLPQHCESRGVSDPFALALLERLLALNPAARIRAQDAFMVRRGGPRGRRRQQGSVHAARWLRRHLPACTCRLLGRQL